MLGWLNDGFLGSGPISYPLRNAGLIVLDLLLCGCEELFVHLRLWLQYSKWEYEAFLLIK